jgi:hypothetical protein
MNADYDWERSYVSAVLETDRSKLMRRVEDAHAAITARIREMSMDHMGTPEERMAIEFALSGLKILRQDAQQSKQHS